MKWSIATTAVTALTLLVCGNVRAQDQGGQLYQQHCAVCHGSQGEGATGPGLAGNSALQDDRHVVRQILHGGQQMPPFANVLNDQQIATVATYIRTAWGNDFGQIEPQQVADNRLGAPGGEQQSDPQEQEQEQGADDAAQDAQGQEGQAAAGDDAAAQEQEQGEAQAPSDQAQEVTLGIDASADASRVVDGEGRALYRYVYDAPEGTPHCYEPCTNRWIPLLVSGAPTAGEGIGDQALGTVEREDGALQATYRGWPLYRFADDEAGQARGDAISDVWTSVTADVEEVQQSLGTPEGGSGQTPEDAQDDGQENGQQEGDGEQDAN